MSSIVIHTFAPTHLLNNTHPLGKGPKEGKERETLFISKEPNTESKVTNYMFSRAVSREMLAEDAAKQIRGHFDSVPKSMTDVGRNIAAAASTNLREIVEGLNRSIDTMSFASRPNELPKEWKLIPSHKEAAVAFANSVNELVKKRNDKIEASTWIAFLDVVLKILSFGLYHFKESLKAPMLNPLHWGNVCDPKQYKFSFEKSYPALAGLIDSSNSATVYQNDLDNHQQNLIERFFSTKELPSGDDAGLKALMGQIIPGSGPLHISPIGSAWSNKELDDFATKMSEFTKATDRFLSAPLSRIEDAFALGYIAKGAITCKNGDGKIIANIFIRKMCNGEYSLLIWDGKGYSYKVGSPLNIAQALPEDLRNNLESSFLEPLH